VADTLLGLSSKNGLANHCIKIYACSSPPFSMYLPEHADPPVSSTTAVIIALAKSSENGTTARWSSVIGIFTAICGNILISFALNTQRYAHLRLSRDRQERTIKLKEQRRRRRTTRSQNYGAVQDEIAEERAKVNANPAPAGAANGDDILEYSAASNETEPLIPRVDAGKQSSVSEVATRPHEVIDDKVEEKTYLKSPIWWLGISLMTIGEAGNFLAYGFAPASIVSPLGVVALVSNCLIAPLLLGEEFQVRDGIGVIIAIAGCITVVLSASDSNPRLTPETIWHLITAWEFETYFGITIFLIIALSVASNKFGDKSVLIDVGLVGLYGGYTALSTKGIASLLSNTIWRVVTFPISYLLLVVLVFTAVMQIKYINRALQRFNSTVVIPTQFVIFTLSVIVGSAILYRDFEREAAGDSAKFVGGCALTFLGVFAITSGRREEADGGDYSDEEEDEIDLIDEETTQPEIKEREDRAVRRGSIMAGSSTENSDLRRIRTANSAQPSIIVTPVLLPESADHDLNIDLDDTSRESLAGMKPANASAIHSDELTRLPENNRRLIGSNKPPPLHTTTSEPVLGNGELASLVRPQTPLNRNHSGPASDSTDHRTPRTPTRDQRQAPTPDANGLQRPLNRHSVVDLLPGPLTSPLSSSLSAIVADSLRRGVELPTSTFRRKRSKSQRRNPFDSIKRQTTAASKRHSIASGEIDFGNDSATPRPESSPSKGRVRSLSATLTDIFGSSTIKKRRLESQENVNEQLEN